MSRPPRLARMLYRTGLHAYPRSHRSRAAAEMEELFEDLYAEARGDRGRLAAGILALRCSADMVRRGLASRIRGGGRRPSPSGRDGGPVAGVVRLLASLLQDTRYALRGFAASPFVALVAVVVFAAGIGATTIVFTVVEAALLRPLPFADAARLVDMTVRPEGFQSDGVDAGGGLVSIEIHRAWSERAESFEGMAVYSVRTPILTGLGEPVEVTAYPSASGLFPLLGAHPLHGRTFSLDEDRAGAPPTVILSHEFWARWFGSDPEAVGRTLLLNDRLYEIVGVMPSSFRFPIFSRLRNVVWLSWGSFVEEHEAAVGQGGCWVVGKLRPGATLVGATAELDAVVGQLEADGMTLQGQTDWRASVTPLHTWVSGELRTPLTLLLSAVALVLLIACSNVANLLLARGLARSREMSIRAALGAGSWRLVRQVLVESVLLAGAGGLLGLALCHLALPFVLSLAGDMLPRVNDTGLNLQVLVVSIAGIFLTGIVAGCGPALRAASRSRRGVLPGRADPHSTSSPGRLTDLLVTVQVSLTLVLLVAAALLGRSLFGLLRAELGFSPGRVLVAELQLPGGQFPDEAARQAFLVRVRDRVQGLPGVEATAIAAFAPFQEGMISSVALPGSPELEGLPWAVVNTVSPDYFRLAGIPLQRGRIPASSADEGVRQALIDEAAVRAYFPNVDPIGEQLATYGSRDAPLTIVGVVGDVRERSLREDSPPHVYMVGGAVPYRTARLLATADGSPGQAAEAIREALRSVDSGVLVVDRVVPLRSIVSESVERERFYVTLFGAFAMLAILMAGAGIFAVMRYAVHLRTREFGIRIAVGAEARDVVIMVVRRALGLAAIGIALGALGALASTRLLAGLLYGLSPSDTSTFVLGALVLGALALVGSALPAWRAARVDPVRSLRAD